MDLGCVVMAGSIIFIVLFLILDKRENPRISIERSSSPATFTGTVNLYRKVKITGSNDLNSWALHKYPEDIDMTDYSDVHESSADIIIHRDQGVNKIVKGPQRGRIISDAEVERYQQKKEWWE